MRIVSIIEETPRVKRFIFDCSLDFTPGQWVSVWSEKFLDDGKPVRRAFSIASNPNEPLELCIAKGQFFSKFMHESSVGDEFLFKGPFGMFKLKDNKNVFFLAAGTGLAPFVPMINRAIKEGREIVLLYSARSKEEMICKGWLDQIKDKAQVMVTLTREQNPDFNHGRIPTHLRKFVKNNFDYYLCGYTDFIESTTKELSRLNIPKENMLFDKWG